MAIAFHHRAAQPANQPGRRRIALFPGAWNPPTVAHAAIARAALQWADEVVWVLPKLFPHKAFDGADFSQRLEMLRLLALNEPGFSVAVTDAGLYIEIADEAKKDLGSEADIGLLCGRDAAERIATWDYGRPGVFNEMLDRYPLLVAARAGEYLPQSHHAERIIRLNVGPDFDEVSSTEVRARIRQGKDWNHLTPAAIQGIVATIYG